ncbi:Hypothetical predicted protein [Mytilus galloprovincialis]|uniref:Apple domain-containing protein n=1 Tax=Mytilus galloprovincialis TaxID=29158 RepID=A0A8B6EU38_MYTGA|nr:Hypothetical predicted protein [Mytilus galloprovincialis]
MPNNKFVSISLLFFVRFSSVSGNIETIEMSENLNLRDQFSDYNKLGNIESKSLVRCTNICLLTANCRSLFYQKELHQCILHSIDIQESSVNLVSSTGWKYYKTFEESPSTTPSTSPAEKCTDTAGFIYNAGESMCYFIGTPVAVDFDVIETLCSNMNSELIRIDSAQKQAFVQQILDAKESRSMSKGTVRYITRNFLPKRLLEVDVNDKKGKMLIPVSLYM